MKRSSIPQKRFFLDFGEWNRTKRKSRGRESSAGKIQARGFCMQKMLPQITKSVLWDTFYEIMALSGNSVKYRMKGEVVMNIAEHNVLTLDYWRDEVSYEGIL